MSEKLPTTSNIFVDRRKTGRGKSVPNRQRLLRRIKTAIREAHPKDIDAGGVQGAGAKGNVNPVKVTRTSLHEPTFRYAPHTGDHDVVLVGNDHWERGDEFPMDDGEGQGRGGRGGPGEESVDDFVVHISRDEFLSVFFEDCELPDLVDTHEKELPEYQPRHAGLQREGVPAQLRIGRSFKNAYARRRVLTADARRELEALEAERELLVKRRSTVVDGDTEFALIAELEVIDAQIKHLKERIAGVPFFEKLDLRYTKKEKVLIKAADAVFAMIMDISGSMDEDRKRIARKFFSLQYAFIKRKYPQTDLIFIAHTDTPEEMSEEEFFTTRKSGGTIVSPAYTLLNRLLGERYDAEHTNIYLSQASDGDNWDSDNALVITELQDSGLLAKLRHMSYAQVGAGYSGPSYGAVTLWAVLASLTAVTRKLSMVHIDSEQEVFDAFHRVYRRRVTLKRGGG